MEALFYSINIRIVLIIQTIIISDSKRKIKGKVYFDNFFILLNF